MYSVRSTLHLNLAIIHAILILHAAKRKRGSRLSIAPQYQLNTGGDSDIQDTCISEQNNGITVNDVVCGDQDMCIIISVRCFSSPQQSTIIFVRETETDVIIVS